MEVKRLYVALFVLIAEIHLKSARLGFVDRHRYFLPLPFFDKRNRTASSVALTTGLSPASIRVMELRCIPKARASSVCVISSAFRIRLSPFPVMLTQLAK